MARKPNHISNNYRLPGLIGAALANAVQARTDSGNTIDDLDGGATGGILYKLSTNNLDVGWTTGLLWDETNDVLSIGVGASGGLRTQVLYDPSALNAAAVINNWQTVGIANASQNIIHLNYGLQLTGTNNALHAVATQGAVLWDSTGTLTDATGSYSNVRARGTSGGIISDARASRTQIITSGAAQVTVGEGLLVDSPSISNTSTIGTLYGLRIKSQKTGAAVTKGYGVYAEDTSDLNVFAGRTTIGSAADPTTSVTLDVKGTVIKTTPVLVSALPSAATVGSGARAFVSDANSPTFGSTVAGSGSTPCPVYSDGTNWKVG